MDISIQRLQFLDLTDASENDQALIEQVLFSSSNHALEVPWCSLSSEAVNNQAEKEWNNILYRNYLKTIQNSKCDNRLVNQDICNIEGKSEVCEEQTEHESNNQQEESSCSQGHQQEQIPRQAGIFPGHPSASLPHQAQMYQMLPSLSNVYVSNVTANVSVHAPYVQPIPAHYGHQVSPQQQQQTPQQLYSPGPLEGNDQSNRGRRQRQKTDKKREGAFVQANEVVPPIDGHPPAQFPSIPPLPPYYLSGAAGTPVYMMPVYPSPVFTPYTHTPAPMVYPQANNLEHESEEYHESAQQNFHQEDSRVVVVGCPLNSENVSSQVKGVETNGTYSMELGEQMIQDVPNCQPNFENGQFKEQNTVVIFQENRGHIESAKKEEIISNYQEKKEMIPEIKMENTKQCTSEEQLKKFSGLLKEESIDSFKDSLKVVRNISAQNKKLNCELDVNKVNEDCVNTKSQNNMLPKEDESLHPFTSVLQVEAEKIKQIKNTNIKVVDIQKLSVQASQERKDLSEVVREEKETLSTFTTPIPQVTTPDQMSSSLAGKSWASLFNRSEQLNRNLRSENRGRPLARVQPYIETENNTFSSPDFSTSAMPSTEVKLENLSQLNINGSILAEPANILNDPYLYNLGAFLCKYELEHRIISLQPRGLTNRSNWCYVNAILQSLIACPPFYNLLKALPVGVGKKKSKQTLIMDALVEYVNEFNPMPANARIGKREKSVRNKDENNIIEIVTGPAFEPSGIYKILNKVRGESSFNVEGRQEDAEEFLSCLLNGLNDEMFELMKMVDADRSKFPNGDSDISFEGVIDDDDSEWNVMGPKNKSSITRRAVYGKTPISDIFRGQFRSRVQRAGDHSTDTVQPFFTLQLDIEKANSVKDALELFMGKDPLEGVTCSRTHQEVEAWTQTTLEDLPLVLILHLKCYDYKSDACSKIIKSFDFQVDLKIDGKLLANRNKYTGKQRNYKLVAVVYHDGKEANKGHYVTDAYHVGYGCWLRYDDVVVRPVPESHVLKPRAPRVPYLLYYRRGDTIGSVK